MTGFVRQTLAKLLAELPFGCEYDPSAVQVPVTAIAYDSRTVQPGTLFVALMGTNSDGHNYIPQAIALGAVAVVGMQALGDMAVPYVRVEDSRAALAYLSAAFYGFPARQLRVIGITGTDGKTTTANLMYQILLGGGCRAGIVSTVNAVIGTEVVDTGFHVTTPEAPEVQRYLARMVAAGLTHVVLEATSHGLAQHRVTGCEFDVGVVTNITHEHLDYHGNYDAYRAAKARLFTGLRETHEKIFGNPRLSVLNRDDLSYEYLRQVAIAPQISYGLESADVWAEDVQHSPSGLRFTAVGPGFRIPVQSSLVGAFNVSNILAAISATVLGMGVPPEAAQAGIAGLHSVPGRMERIDMGQDFVAIVDFAHTPNALRRALETVRRITERRVLVVFGSAGLRDREKRHLMAEVSAELADVTILTAEDPRTESLEDILTEMAESARRRGATEGQTFYRVADRGDALRMAVRMAEAGDVVIACGKGHEQSMCFGTTEFMWDDRVAMRAALAERMGIPGIQMPYLPTREKRLPEV